MCPGNHESAGKHHDGTTCKGDPWLRGALGEAASAASRTNHTYLQTRYRGLAGRRGEKRALVAVGHSILTTTWQMITNDLGYHDLGYHDLGPDHFLTRGDPARHTRPPVSQPQQLDFRVTPDPAS